MDQKYGAKVNVLKNQESKSNTTLLLVIPALCMAFLASFGVFQFENFYSNLELIETATNGRSLALKFAFPFIIITTISIAAISFVAIKYQQRSTQLKKLVDECLENLQPKKQVAQHSVDQKEEVIRVKKKLAESKIQMNQLIHIVTHDLRGPLRTINSFTSLLKKSLGNRLSEKERNHMKFIHSDTMKLNTILEEVAQFSRIEDHLIKPKTVSLSEILNQALNVCQNEITATDSKISIPTELPNLFCDERKIKEVFTQIIRNSIRYSVPGSQPKLDITFTEDNSNVEFKFTDNGLGISQEFLEKIFLPFNQIKIKANQKGIGIGLAICKKYVELHEGKIWCTSTPGNTTFTLSLKKHQSTVTQDIKLNLATTSI